MTDRVVFLMGPTASGKTDLVTALADRWQGELVSVDAAQVYRGMNIGTAKPDAGFLARWPHHLVDILEPTESYSAAAFRRDALRLIEEIHRRGRLPILVGGTMFYFAALEHGLSDLPASDPQVRREIDAEIAHHGLAAMHEKLLAIDPVAGRSIKPTDPQRIARALEIHRLAGAAPASLMTGGSGKACPWPVIKIGLFNASRAVLHRRIETRFRQMLDQGLVAEVEGLLAAGVDPGQHPAMRSVGYRQVVEHLAGEYGSGEMVARGVAATRQLAKRQLTWMRGQSNLLWVESGQPGAEEALQTYLGGALGP